MPLPKSRPFHISKLIIYSDWTVSVIAKKIAVRCLFGVLSLAALPGCAALPYSFSSGDVSSKVIKLAENEPQIERGEPYWLLDGLGHYLISLPTKLVLFNWNMENHDISKETEIALTKYLDENQLSSVKVRLNQYSPGDEWSRLVGNESVAWGWRYSVGALSWLFYTVFPGRLFGGDNYNPYTNTINIYSDHQAVALHEGGHAKDFALTESKGSYAFLGLIPFSSLYFEAEATGDAVGYLKAKKNRIGERESYKVLYPAYATYIGGELTQFISIFTPINSLIGLVAVIPAHIAGRMKASNVQIEETALPAQYGPEISTDSGQVKDKESDPPADFKTEQSAEHGPGEPKESKH